MWAKPLTGFGTQDSYTKLKKHLPTFFPLLKSYLSNRQFRTRVKGEFSAVSYQFWDPPGQCPRSNAVEWKRNLVAHGDAQEEKWRGKRRMEWVAKQASFWLGTVHPVLLQSFSADPHSKKASTRMNWHPRRYKWTRPFHWKTESGFCACAVTIRFHSTFYLHQTSHRHQTSR